MNTLKAGHISVGRRGENVRGYENIKVDRSSILGNPYVMNGEADRDFVCNQYEIHFKKAVASVGSPFHKEMIRLYNLAKSGKHLNLMCHCAPKRCHGNTIRDFLRGHLDPKPNKPAVRMASNGVDTVCKCGKGYANAEMGICRPCYLRSLSRAELRKLGESRP
jgi:hypothetical protein